MIIIVVIIIIVIIIIVIIIIIFIIMDLGGLLERLWSDFGPELGARLRPSCHQHQKQKVSRRCQKND